MIILLLSLADTSPAMIPIPGAGAVCPLIVMDEDKDTADLSTMYPLTSKTILRLDPLTASRYIRCQSCKKRILRQVYKYSNWEEPFFLHTRMYLRKEE